LTKLETDITAKKAQIAGMSAGGAKTAAEDELTKLNTDKTAAVTAKATADSAFNTAKTQWDTAETTRIAQEQTDKDSEADAEWTEAK
jgi:hypothetical protein